MEAQELGWASIGVRSITNNINFGLGLKNLVLDQQFAILQGLSHFKKSCIHSYFSLS